jgi:ribosomal protein S18 acetylase RimI-like enzyme
MNASEIAGGYHLRTYAESDAPQLAGLWDDFYDELVALDSLKRLRRGAGYGTATLARTLDEIALNEGVLYVVADEGRIVAFAVGIIIRPSPGEALELVPSSRGRLTELYVAPAYRGRSLGTRLAQAVERYCAAQGCDVIRVEVFAPNQAARRLYEKLGFAERDIDLMKAIRRSD